MIRLIIKKLKDNYSYRETVFHRLTIYSGIMSFVCCLFGILELVIAKRYSSGLGLLGLFLFFGLITILTPED